MGKNQERFINLARIAGGIALSIILYQIALFYATMDCQTLQDNIRLGGYLPALKILAGLIFLFCLGMPIAIGGLAAGLLLGPVVSGPFASLAVLISSILFWALGQQLTRLPLINSFIELKLASQTWFQKALEIKSTSGFHWVVSQGITAKVPLPIFAFLLGAKVPHLTVASLVAGIFASSVFYIAGYSLAGASIGCAVVNHSLGVSYESYKTLMLMSCFVLLVLSRVQSNIQRKNES